MKKYFKCIRVLHIGEVISYTGIMHGSVGISYKLKYNKEAFKESLLTKSLYQPREGDYFLGEQTGERQFMCPPGGDAVEVKYNL